jgi:antitoxin ChpS
MGIESDDTERGSSKTVYRAYNRLYGGPMLKASLREVDGAVMLPVPSAVAEMLELRAGSVVALNVDGGRLVVEPQRKPKYTLQELLDQCDFSLPMSTEEREWLDAPRVGEELL